MTFQISIYMFYLIKKFLDMRNIINIKRVFLHQKKGVTKIRSFYDLKPGDYIVHVNHGIGVYKGIKKIDVQGIERDYLDIEYEKKDKLYVPIEQLDLVQKYIGIEGKSPKLNKLGGNEWVKVKTKTRRSIDEIADNLVKLYAKRNILKGYAYSKDSTWQFQFEQEFPYEETPDQLLAIEDIKKDMESDKPMDRLLCGDVGYGKTEVALRAMFKAVVDKRQVAFLVPTTILVEQHYNNIKKRFEGFPFNVDVLSRFRTGKQQKETLSRLKLGEVDIIIGTHRLLSKDVQFKHLGLLIIDEEQRFGVKHKEKIKEMKENIDVLSLSATPIPRTLHMSMVGVRDISVIDTPPEDRYPVQTFVVEYSDQLIRGAIMKEISRGGQGFFLYNSVENIDKMNIYLQNLIPECRFSVIHGQMGEREIEDIIIKFLDKEIDFLVCTTIIETGIDIKNANTIIIYNADKFGLSQLYQLRGRVGRSNKVAYAYLTYKKDRVLSEVAEKRLKTLKDFTELGSGFKVAMKDLEIRGSGNLIGESQHGQMSVVGYDLYCKMLEDAIKMIQGEVKHEEINTVVDIKIDVYIKDNYIEDEMQKLEIYKKISCIEDEKDISYIREELMDRFSTIPIEIDNLIKISYIRALGKKLGFSQIKEIGDKVLFEYADKKFLTDYHFNLIYNNYQDEVIFNLGDNPCFYYKINCNDKSVIINEFIKLLEKLIKDVKK
nr:transcription-repair coupling factor [Candidatus Arthromitus sp. SFB-rat-Yit]